MTVVVGKVGTAQVQVLGLGGRPWVSAGDCERGSSLLPPRWRRWW